jgi:hypothetical protein
VFGNDGDVILFDQLNSGALRLPIHSLVPYNRDSQELARGPCRYIVRFMGGTSLEAPVHPGKGYCGMAPLDTKGVALRSVSLHTHAGTVKYYTDVTDLGI